MSANRHAVEILVEFSRLISRAAAPDEVLPVLSVAVVEHLGVDAAAVLQLTTSGQSLVVASTGLPTTFSGFIGHEDLANAELGDALLSTLGSEFTFAVTIPLASAGSMFGSLVLLSRQGRDLSPDQLVLLEGLVGITAAGLSCTAQYAELAKSYADLRASRAALERGEKLRALGQMAASVSHDLRNIINPLSLHLQFLKRSVPKDEKSAQGSIVEMQGVLKRGLENIERLMDFSRQSPTTKAERVNLDHVAHEAIEIAKPRARGKHDVHFKFVEAFATPPMVMLASGECVAALVNLLVNAIDAMPTGGTITVSTGVLASEAFVRVADDGPGMSEEVERRVFEPFFTTKGDEGTGLGLAMVYAFAKRHLGRVTLETSPGSGAAFTLHFPIDVTS